MVVFVKHLPQPDHVVELDMSKVVKQTIYLTLISFIILFILQIVINQVFSYAFNLITLGLDIMIFSAGYILLIILHEFFHLLGFRVFSKVPWRKMKVGLDLKQGIAYATTPELMTNKAIRKSLLLPFWLTGALPAIVGLYLDSTLLIGLAALLIGGAAGDFSMYRQLKSFPNDWLIKDHPNKPKLFLFAPERLTTNEHHSLH